MPDTTASGNSSLGFEPDCSHCGGWGGWYNSAEQMDADDWTTCPKCKGKGHITPTETPSNG